MKSIPYPCAVLALTFISHVRAQTNLPNESAPPRASPLAAAPNQNAGAAGASGSNTTWSSATAGPALNQVQDVDALSLSGGARGSSDTQLDELQQEVNRLKNGISSNNETIARLRQERDSLPTLDQKLQESEPKLDGVAKDAAKEIPDAFKATTGESAKEAVEVGDKAIDLERSYVDGGVDIPMQDYDGEVRRMQIEQQIDRLENDNQRSDQALLAAAVAAVVTAGTNATGAPRVRQIPTQTSANSRTAPQPSHTWISPSSQLPTSSPAPAYDPACPEWAQSCH